MASKRIAFMNALLLVLVLSASVKTISAQTTSQYWVTVNHVTSSSIVYGNVEKNWTIPFQAVWSYGENSGQVVENATVTIEVKTMNDESVASITETTNSTGFASVLHILKSHNADFHTYKFGYPR